jgi:hypothetical protein
VFHIPATSRQRLKSCRTSAKPAVASLLLPEVRRDFAARSMWIRADVLKRSLRKKIGNLCAETSHLSVLSVPMSSFGQRYSGRVESKEVSYKRAESPTRFPGWFNQASGWIEIWRTRYIVHRTICMTVKTGVLRMKILHCFGRMQRTVDRERLCCRHWSFHRLYPTVRGDRQRAGINERWFDGLWLHHSKSILPW